MKTKHILYLSIGMLLLGSLITWLFMRTIIPEPEIVNNYFTDTVYADWVKPPKPNPIYIKPDKVTVYLGVKDSLRLIRINDSLQGVINDSKSKTDTVFISNKFLSLFPKNPKLIAMELKMDSLSITLLDIQANLTTQRFPLQLLHFEYVMLGSGLTAKKIPYKGKGKDRLPMNILFTPYYGYSVINQKQLAGTELSFNVTRITLRGDFNLTIENKPTLDIQGRIGIPFKVWQRR